MRGLGDCVFCDLSLLLSFSRKLNSSQRNLSSARRNYTVGEKELLSIVESLEEFRTMLYWCKEIHVYTDHKNNTFQRLQTQQLVRWRLFLEELGVQLHYINGETDHPADTLSRLPYDDAKNNQLDKSIPVWKLNGVDIPPSLSSDPTALDAYYPMAIHDDDFLACFVHLPDSEGIPFVLQYKKIRDSQAEDARLADPRQRKPDSYVVQQVSPNGQLVGYRAAPNAAFKVYLPASLYDAVRWYHLSLGHIGITRLTDTISLHLYHPDLRTKVGEVVSRCGPCQLPKNNTPGYGQLALRQTSSHPRHSSHTYIISSLVELHSGTSPLVRSVRACRRHGA